MYSTYTASTLIYIYLLMTSLLGSGVNSEDMSAVSQYNEDIMLQNKH